MYICLDFYRTKITVQSWVIYGNIFWFRWEFRIREEDWYEKYVRPYGSSISYKGAVGYKCFCLLISFALKIAFLHIDITTEGNMCYIHCNIFVLLGKSTVLDRYTDSIISLCNDFCFFFYCGKFKDVRLIRCPDGEFVRGAFCSLYICVLVQYFAANDESIHKITACSAII